MFLDKYVSKKRNKFWVLAFIPMVLSLFLILVGISLLLLKVPFGNLDFAILTILSLIASFAICAFGYAGLKTAFMFCASGVIAGILFMAYVFAQPIEWRGIVGLVSGSQLAFLFFLAGINLQMIQYVIHRRRNHS